MEDQYIEYLRGIYKRFGGTPSFGKFQDFINTMSDDSVEGGQRRREFYTTYGGQQEFDSFDTFTYAVTGGAIWREGLKPEDNYYAEAALEAEDVKKKSSLYQYGDYSSPFTGDSEEIVQPTETDLSTFIESKQKSLSPDTEYVPGADLVQEASNQIAAQATGGGVDWGPTEFMQGIDTPPTKSGEYKDWTLANIIGRADVIMSPESKEKFSSTVAMATALLIPGSMDERAERFSYTKRLVSNTASAINAGILQGQINNNAANEGAADSQRMSQLQAQLKEESKDLMSSSMGPDVSDFFSTMAKDPIRFMSELFTQSMASQITAIGGLTPMETLPGIAVSFINPIAGASYFTAINSTSIEMSSGIIEKLEQKGFDTTNPDDLKKAFGDDTLIQEIKDEIGMGASFVGALDGISLGMAGKITTGLASRGISNKLFANAMEVSAQAVYGGAGEAGKQLLNEGKITSASSILSEMVIEGPVGIIENSVGAKLNDAPRIEEIKQQIEKINVEINKEGIDPQVQETLTVLKNDLIKEKNSTFKGFADYVNALDDDKKTQLESAYVELGKAKKALDATENEEVKVALQKKIDVISDGIKSIEEQPVVAQKGKKVDVSGFKVIENKDIATLTPEQIVDADKDWFSRRVETVKAARILRDIKSLAGLSESNIAFAPDKETYEKSFGNTNAAWDSKTNTIYINPDKSRGNIYFHELSHPIVRKIRTSDPELFKNLYDKVQSIAKEVGSEKSEYGQWAKTMYGERTATIQREEAIVELFADAADGKFESAPTSVKRKVVEFIADFLTAIGLGDYADSLISQFEGREDGVMRIGDFVKNIRTSGIKDADIYQRIRNVLDKDVTETVKQEVPRGEQVGKAPKQAPVQEVGTEAPAPSGVVQTPEEEVKAPIKKAKRPTRKPKDAAGRPERVKPADKKIKSKVAEADRLPKDQWAQKTYDEAIESGNKGLAFRMKRLAEREGFELKLAEGDAPFTAAEKKDIAASKKQTKKTKSTKKDIVSTSKKLEAIVEKAEVVITETPKQPVSFINKIRGNVGALEKMSAKEILFPVDVVDNEVFESKYSDNETFNRVLEYVLFNSGKIKTYRSRIAWIQKNVDDSYSNKYREAKEVKSMSLSMLMDYYIMDNKFEIDVKDFEAFSSAVKRLDIDLDKLVIRIAKERYPILLNAKPYLAKEVTQEEVVEEVDRLAKDSSSRLPDGGYYVISNRKEFIVRRGFDEKNQVESREWVVFTSDIDKAEGTYMGTFQTKSKALAALPKIKKPEGKAPEIKKATADQRIYDVVDDLRDAPVTSLFPADRTPMPQQKMEEAQKQMSALHLELEDLQRKLQKQQSKNFTKAAAKTLAAIEEVNKKIAEEVPTVKEANARYEAYIQTINSLPSEKESAKRSKAAKTAIEEQKLQGEIDQRVMDEVGEMSIKDYMGLSTLESAVSEERVVINEDGSIHAIYDFQNKTIKKPVGKGKKFKETKVSSMFGMLKKYSSDMKERVPMAGTIESETLSAADAAYKLLSKNIERLYVAGNDGTARLLEETSLPRAKAAYEDALDSYRKKREEKIASGDYKARGVEGKLTARRIPTLVLSNKRGKKVVFINVNKLEIGRRKTDKRGSKSIPYEYQAYANNSAFMRAVNALQRDVDNGTLKIEAQQQIDYQRAAANIRGIISDEEYARLVREADALTERNKARELRQLAIQKAYDQMKKYLANANKDVQALPDNLAQLVKGKLMSKPLGAEANAIAEFFTDGLLEVSDRFRGKDAINVLSKNLLDSFNNLVSDKEESDRLKKFVELNKDVFNKKLPGPDIKSEEARLRKKMFDKEGMSQEAWSSNELFLDKIKVSLTGITLGQAMKSSAAMAKFLGNLGYSEGESSIVKRVAIDTTERDEINNMPSSTVEEKIELISTILKKGDVMTTDAVYAAASTLFNGRRLYPATSNILSLHEAFRASRLEQMSNFEDFMFSKGEATTANNLTAAIAQILNKTYTRPSITNLKHYGILPSQLTDFATKLAEYRMGEFEKDYVDEIESAIESGYAPELRDEIEFLWYNEAVDMYKNILVAAIDLHVSNELNTTEPVDIYDKKVYDKFFVFEPETGTDRVMELTASAQKKIKELAYGIASYYRLKENKTVSDLLIADMAEIVSNSENYGFVDASVVSEAKFNAVPGGERVFELGKKFASMPENGEYTLFEDRDAAGVLLAQINNKLESSLEYQLINAPLKYSVSETKVPDVIKSIGQNKFKDLIKKNNPIGLPANNLTDIANAFAFISSSIRESSVFIAVKDGKIIDADYHTSMLYGRVQIDFRNDFVNLYPDAKIIHIHNHPTGNPMFSDADFKSSLSTERKLGDRYGGAIIVNKTQYGFISPVGSIEEATRLQKLTRESIDDAIKQHGKIGVASYQGGKKSSINLRAIDLKKTSRTTTAASIALMSKERGYVYAVTSVDLANGQYKVVEFGQLPIDISKEAALLKLQNIKFRHPKGSMIHLSFVTPQEDINGVSAEKAYQKQLELEEYLKNDLSGTLSTYQLVNLFEKDGQYTLSTDAAVVSDIAKEKNKTPFSREKELGTFTLNQDLETAVLVSDETIGVVYQGEEVALSDMVTIALEEARNNINDFLSRVSLDEDVQDNLKAITESYYLDDNVYDSIQILKSYMLSNPASFMEGFLKNALIEYNPVVKEAKNVLGANQAIAEELIMKAIEDVSKDVSLSYDPDEMLYSKTKKAISSWKNTTSGQQWENSEEKAKQSLKQYKRKFSTKLKEAYLDKKHEVYRFINHELNADNVLKGRLLDAQIRTSAGINKSVEQTVKDDIKYIFGKSPMLSDHLSILFKGAEEGNVVSAEWLKTVGQFLADKTILEHNRRRLDKLQKQYDSKEKALGSYESVEAMSAEYEAAKEQLKYSLKEEKKLLLEIADEKTTDERLEVLNQELEVNRELVDEATALTQDLNYRLAVIKGAETKLKSLQEPLINPEGKTVEDIESSFEQFKRDNPDAYNEITEIVNRFFDVAKRVAMEKKEAGLITEAQANALAEYGYSPRIFIRRALDAKELNVSVRGQSADAAIKTLTSGSENPMVTNPIAMLSAMIGSHMNSMSKNESASRLYDFVETVPENGVIEIIEPTIKNGKRVFPSMSERAGYTVVEFLRGGQKFRISVPIDFYKSWKGLESMGQVDWIRWMSGSHLTKLGATIANPNFGMGNLTTDFIFTTVFTKTFGSFLPYTMLRASSRIIPQLANSMLFNNPIYKQNVKSIREAIESGISMDYATRNPVEEFTDEPSIKAYNLAKDWVYNAVTFIQENMELATRLGIYEAQKEKLSKLYPDLNQKDINLLAAQMSRQHLDYSIAGTKLGSFEQFVPYVNAALRALETSIYSVSPMGGNYLFGTKLPVDENGKINKNKVLDLTISTNIAFVCIGYMAIMYFNNAIGMRDDDEDDHDLKHINDEVKNRNLVLLTGERNAQGEPRYHKHRLPYELVPFIRMTQMMVEGTQFSDHHQDNFKDAVRLSFENIPLIGQSLGAYAKGDNKLMIAYNFLGQIPIAASTLAYAGNYDTFYDQKVWHASSNEISPEIEIDYNTRPSFIKAAHSGVLGEDVSPKRLQVAFEKIFTNTRTNYFSNVIFNNIDNMVRQNLIDNNIIIPEQVRTKDEQSGYSIVSRITDNYGNIDWQKASIYEGLNKSKDYATRRASENQKVKALVKSLSKDGLLGTQAGDDRLNEVIVKIAPNDLARQRELKNIYGKEAMPKMLLSGVARSIAEIDDATKKADAMVNLRATDPEAFNQVLEDIRMYERITGKKVFTKTVMERFIEFSEEGD